MKLKNLNLFQSDQDWQLKKLKYPKATIKLGSTFSGIGSIEQALERLNLNYKIQFAGDIDPFVKTSYFENYKITEQSWHDDITKFDASPYKNKVDLLVGGAPCQAFSMVGKRLGLEDTRGTLFYDFARVVAESQPKTFIFENVAGLMNHDSGKTWKVIHQVFDD